MNEEEIVAYNQGIMDALTEVQRAREEGEGDMRQVINWITPLLKKQGTAAKFCLSGPFKKIDE